MIKTTCRIMTWAGVTGLSIAAGICTFCDSVEQAFIGIGALFVSCLMTTIGALGYDD